MYLTTAPAGATNQRRVMALLLQARGRLANAVAALAALGRRAYGFGADLAERVQILGLANAARALLTGSLDWARKTVLVAGPVVARLRIPVTLAAALLSSEEVRALLGGVATRLRQVAKRAAAAVAARLTQATGLGSRAVSHAARSVVSAARTLRQVGRRVLGSLGSRATLLAQQTWTLVGANGIPMSVLAFGLLAPASALLAVALWLSERLRHRLSTTRPRPGLPATHLHARNGEPKGSQEPVDSLSTSEIEGVYEAMLTLETALPDITVMVVEAARNGDRKARQLGDGVLTECRQQMAHLVEFTSELQVKQARSAAETALAADIQALLDRVEPQLANLENLTYEGSSEPAATPNRATRRAATTQDRRQTKRRPAPAAATT